jgi:hypothetical protein
VDVPDRRMDVLRQQQRASEAVLMPDIPSGLDGGHGGSAISVDKKQQPVGRVQKAHEQPPLESCSCYVLNQDYINRRCNASAAAFVFWKRKGDSNAGNLLNRGHDPCPHDPGTTRDTQRGRHAGDRSVRSRAQRQRPATAAAAAAAAEVAAAATPSSPAATVGQASSAYRSVSSLAGSTPSQGM